MIEVMVKEKRLIMGYFTAVVSLFAAAAQLTAGTFDKNLHVTEDMVNPQWSPDSSMIAYTKDNDLWVKKVEDGKDLRLTDDGSELILNGYASWVYYEEILGRPSRYRAFWWSPDSRRIAFYRFDNSKVPYFPIYSPFSGSSDADSLGHSGYPGRINATRYPKAGQWNPLVRIGFVDLDALYLPDLDARVSGEDRSYTSENVVWADFPLVGGDHTVSNSTFADSYGEDAFCDGYFGIPFWNSDGSSLCVPTLPRIQNDLNLFLVDAADGHKDLIYNEKYSTWLSWFDNVVFGKDGLYVARRFETGWDQIYFISYDGKTVRRLTDGHFWSAAVLKVDEKAGVLYFTAKLNGAPRTSLFSLSLKNARRLPQPLALTPSDMNVDRISIADDFKSCTVRLSNSCTPPVDYKCLLHNGIMRSFEPVPAKAAEETRAKTAAGSPDAGAEALSGPRPVLVSMMTSDGFDLPGMITLPKDFDSTGRVKYPVVMEIYGGPDTPYVRDRYRRPSETEIWMYENGIVKIVCDSRAAGHNGREGEDYVYKDLTTAPVNDFCEWADYLSSLPYIDGGRIGGEGFSFGGTMTAMLVMRHPERFCCGIAGGGVYDWTLYDSHYTERFMETPQTNAEGYASSCVLNYVSEYKGNFDCDSNSGAYSPVLMLTHGTGDDNVHFQNTLVLVDRLQKEGKNFELMIYPDGMHGYRGYQGRHSSKSDRLFWSRYLLDR